MSAAKVVLVTGADGGIGRAVASSFEQAGCGLFLGDLGFPIAPEQSASAAGRLSFKKRLDVTSESAVNSFFEDAIAIYGKIDVVINCAGVTSFGSLADLPLEEWERVLRVNLTGVFLCCKAALLAMRSRRSGAIINIGSVVAKNGGNARPWLDPAQQLRTSNVAYGASKAGVHTLTIFLAKEAAAYGITVNAVAPGPIATRMTENLPAAMTESIPLGRLGRPEEVAHACQFLASENASHITGEILDMNGGLWCD